MKQTVTSIRQILLIFSLDRLPLSVQNCTPSLIAELQRREALTGFPGAATATLKELSEEIVNSAPVYIADKPPDLNQVKQSCLDLKKSRSTPQ